MCRICVFGCSEYQKISKFWCSQAVLLRKLDVAIVGWTSLKILYIAIFLQKIVFFENAYRGPTVIFHFGGSPFFTFTQNPLRMAQNDIFLLQGELKTQIWAIFSGFWVKKFQNH